MIRNYLECSRVPIHKVQPRLRLAAAQAQYVPINTHATWHHAQSIASNGDEKEDKTLLQHSQLPQHGEFWYASVSERQRSRACGQNCCVPFLRTVMPPEVEASARAMAATARPKRSYLHHQGEFQHNYFDFMSLHDSDHDGVVRISVRYS